MSGPAFPSYPNHQQSYYAPPAPTGPGAFPHPNAGANPSWSGQGYGYNGPPPTAPNAVPPPNGYYGAPPVAPPYTQGNPPPSSTYQSPPTTAPATPSSSSGYVKPKVETLRFQQKKPHKSGQVVNSSGQVLYRVESKGDKHDFSKYFVDYPLLIYRASDNKLLCKLDWGDKPDKASAKDFEGQAKRKVNGELLDANLSFQFHDDKTGQFQGKFEWDGPVWSGDSFTLLDYRVAQPFSVVPASSAKFYPRGTQDKNDSILEYIERAINSVEGLLDYMIVTVLWLEYKTYYMKTEKAASEAAQSVASAAGGS